MLSEMLILGSFNSFFNLYWQHPDHPVVIFHLYFLIDFY